PWIHPAARGPLGSPLCLTWGARPLSIEVSRTLGGVARQPRPRLLPVIALGILLTVEVLALTLRFDGATLGGQGHGPVRLLVAGPRVMAGGICFVAVTVLLAFRSASLRARSRELVESLESRRGPWGIVCAQICAYGGFAAIPGVVFEGQALPHHPAAWA